MRLRHWTALTFIVCVGAILTLREGRQAQVPVEPMGASSVALQDVDTPVEADAKDQDQALSRDISPVDGNKSARPLDEEVVRWSRVVGPGESLNLLLAKAGLDAATRAKVSNSFGSEFDLRKLQPGNRLSLEIRPNGIPRTATLEIEDGVKIHALFGSTLSVDVLPPDLQTIHQAAETEIESSIYTALDIAGIPTRFATDLELILAGTLDLQRALVGGEHLRVVWREHRLEDRIIGQPKIDFAELDMGEDRYEIVWPDDDSRSTSIFKNGQLLMKFDQPINGARLSSPFGLREHPVHDIVRMHDGVDFAAKHGASVHATQAGRLSFIGRRSGYGLMIEVEHVQDIRTVYAHLSAVNEQLKIGQSVEAGHNLGFVGSTGISTAPHLHYEVVVEGRPVPPLTDPHLSPKSHVKPGHRNASVLIETARDQLARILETNG